MRENIAPYVENIGERREEGYEYDEYTLDLPASCDESWLTAHFDALLAQAKTESLEAEAMTPANVIKMRRDVDAQGTTTDDVIEYAAENDYRICLLELGLTPNDL